MTSPKTARWSWAGPVALMLGLLAAQAVIYASTGWRDGFMDPDLWRLKRRFLRHLPWTLPAAALVGVLLQAFHRRWLGLEGRQVLGGWPVLVAILRAFLHFPFYGFFVLLQFTGILFVGLAKGCWLWVRRQKVKEGALGLSFMDSTALWMIIGSFKGMKDEDGNRVAFEWSPSELASRGPRLLPLVLFGLWVWTGAESEDSGERVNAFLLSLPATVWVGDFFLLLWMNRPFWLRRH